MDDGQCDEEFHSCGHRIGGFGEGGFSAFDSSELWYRVTIPVLLVTKATGEKLQNLMDTKRVNDQIYTLTAEMIGMEDEL